MSRIRLGAGAPVQSLVYILIAVSGIALGLGGYFGLGFTPIEGLLTALLVAAVALGVLERVLRRRGEARLAAALDDVSARLAAGSRSAAMLEERVTALADSDTAARLAALEADISVLGTVVRQVAESVAELEEKRQRALARPEPAAARVPVAEARSAPAEVEASPRPAVEPEAPRVPLDALARAIDEGRMVFQLQPIVTLPQRRIHGYDLVPCFPQPDGTLLKPPDYLPTKGGEAPMQRLDRLCLEEAIDFARRARITGQPGLLHVPLSRWTRLESSAAEALAGLIEVNRGIAEGILVNVPEADWSGLLPRERSALAGLVGKGIGLSLIDARGLRLDFADLSARGVRSVRIDAARFLEQPETITDFHSSDVASYLKRFGVDLIATGIENEEQILRLVEDAVPLAAGPRIAASAPGRPGPAPGRSRPVATPDPAEA